MRRSIALLTALFLLISTLPAGAAHDDGPAAFNAARELQEQADRQLHSLQHELNAMERLADQLPACSIRDELLRKIESSRRLGRKIARTSDGLVALAESGPAPAMFVPQAMSEDDFRRISAALQPEWWDESRYELLVDVAQNRLFSSRQVARIMGLFSFGDSKVDAAAFLYDRVVDPQDFYTVYDQLTFRSEKEDLRRRIRG